MTDQHAPIAPSSLERIVPCPGSVAMSAAYPELPDEHTEEGKAAHWVAHSMALGVPGEYLLTQTAPNGVQVTDEMIEGGEVWVEALEGYPGLFETTVPIRRIHPSACWGTPDGAQYNPERKWLRIPDYKFGHKYVEVFENWQLIAYTLGEIERLGLIDSETTCELMLVQPRSYHRDGPVRKWIINGADLRPLANIAEAAAHEAMGPNPKTKSGPHCAFCPARFACVTLQKAASNFMDFAGVAAPILREPADVGRELRLVNIAIERLTARQTGLEEQANAALRSGQVVPFFQLEETNPREVWTAPPEEVVEAFKLLKSEAKIGKLALVTPKQAIKAGIPEAVVKQYSDRPRGTMKVKPLDTIATRKVFG